jgi:hypothetical protein
MLAAQLPATAADEERRRAKKAATLGKHLRRIEATQNGILAELDEAAGDTSAMQAYRARRRARFVELEEERAAKAAELDTLATAANPYNDPTLLDELPHLPGLLPEAPPRLIAALLDAFDIQCLYNKEDDQVTIRAVLTDATPQAVADLTSNTQPPAGTSHPEPAPPDSAPVYHSSYGPMSPAVIGWP